MSDKEPYDSPILQEFMTMKHENLFPMWPPDRPIESLFHLPPVESEHLLPESPEEWSACVVTEDFDAYLYIFCDGTWWQLPKMCQDMAPALYKVCMEEEQFFREQAAEALYEALSNLIELGKRDLTNPKYDSYFAQAMIALQHYESKFKK